MIEDKIANAICSLNYLLQMSNLNVIRIWLPTIADVPNSPYTNRRYQCRTAKYMILREIQEEVFNFLIKLHAKEGSEINTLELRNLLAYSLPESVYSNEFRIFLQSIKTLSLHMHDTYAVGYNGMPGDREDTRGFTRDIAHAVINGSCNVETLIFDANGKINEYYSAERWEEWRSIFLPKLRCFWLKNILFDVLHYPEVTDTEERRIVASAPVNFLLRHHTTLQELHMESCLTGWDDSSI